MIRGKDADVDMRIKDTEYKYEDIRLAGTDGNVIVRDLQVFILLLVGVTFNFGRMNARNNNKAQAAIRDMKGL